jgi:2-succinyl-5-enolpyruvyl-6-hydroxy-3-cyclohexene-1-carboxylate synthase
MIILPIEMTHHLQHISDLVALLEQKGIRHIVASPGSRNAPIVSLMATVKQFKIHGIVDERCAAFYALGISMATSQPVVLVCTSGSAVLNYAPAIAEAYYSHVPLIVITADRPEELIDQQDNQTIRQRDVYRNFIKESIHLIAPNKKGYSAPEQHKSIATIINNASAHIKCPVHINVPLSEPLSVPMPLANVTSVEVTPVEVEISATLELQRAWSESRKRIIICGQNPPDSNLSGLLNHIADTHQALVIAEPISNVKGSKVVSSVERIVRKVKSENGSAFTPDLLLSMGGPVVSKSLKEWLQKQDRLVHFRLSAGNEKIDTYHNLKETLVCDVCELLQGLLPSPSCDQRFITNWQEAGKQSGEQTTRFLEQAAYSDLKVFHRLVQLIPKGATLHLGNSSPVRYAQLFDLQHAGKVMSNRGVSGIDGCMSTAAGYASVDKNLNVLILGDLSFFYDSNALWNRNFPANLRVIVINNRGGGIFSLLQGTSQQAGFEEFIEAWHPASVQKMAETFGISYYHCNSMDEVERQFPVFLNDEGHPAILEISTLKEINTQIYNDFIKLT